MIVAQYSADCIFNNMILNKAALYGGVSGWIGVIGIEHIIFPGIVLIIIGRPPCRLERLTHCRFMIGGHARLVIGYLQLEHIADRFESRIGSLR